MQFELPPRLSSAKTPEAEKDAVWVMETTLSDLGSRCFDFQAALALFHTAPKLKGNGDEAQRVIIHWTAVAARDGAMTIYHFGKSLEGIRSSMNETPSIKATADHDRIRKAWKAFREYFPLYETMRHAIAHSAELTNTPRAHQRNAFSGSYEGGGIKIEASRSGFITSIDNTSFTTTFEGEIISYSITEESLARLNEVRREVWAAFPQG